MAIIAAASTAISAGQNILGGIKNVLSSFGASAAFQQRDAVRSQYWNSLNQLYDAVKAGKFTEQVREMIWRDWPTYLGNAPAVTVFDPVTGQNRTSTAYGAHAGRTGTQADLDYLTGKIKQYEAAQTQAASGSLTGGGNILKAGIAGVPIWAIVLAGVMAWFMFGKGGR